MAYKYNEECEFKEDRKNKEDSVKSSRPSNEFFAKKDFFKSKQKFLTEFADVKNIFSRKILAFFVLVFLVAICFSSAFVFAADQIIISQVLYDPIKTESGGESVELYNPTSSAVNVSSWIIQTESSAQDAVLPKNTFIQPNGFYLIADSGWNLSKDNASWLEADFEDTITLKNADSGIILRNQNNEVIDTVGWGNPNSIFFESSPASQVVEGQSVQRTSLSDTNNNSFDFVSGIPNFRNSKTNSASQPESGSSGAAQEILINITIEPNTPVVSNAWLNTTNNIVTPVEAQSKSIPLLAVVSENCNASVFAKLKEKEYLLVKTSMINSTAAEYSALLEMNYYDAPKNYSIDVYSVCSDLTASEKTIVSFEYAELTAFQMDKKEINLKTKPGNITEYRIPIRNTGNTPLDFKLWSSNLAAVSDLSIEYYFPEDSEPTLLESQPFIKDIEFMPGMNSSTELVVMVKIPETAAAGNYLGKLSIEPVK